MSKTSTQLKETGGKYSYIETAWILNWNDYCLINGLNFQKTISETLETNLNTVRSWRSISDKLRSILRWSTQNHSLNVDNILGEGTKRLRVECYKAELLEPLRSVRDKLGLPPLGEDYIIHTKSEHRAVAIGTRRHAVPTNINPRSPIVLISSVQSKADSTENTRALEDLSDASGTLSSISTDEVCKLDPSLGQDNGSGMSRACTACHRRKVRCVRNSRSESCAQCVKSRIRCKFQKPSLKRETSDQTSSTGKAKKSRVDDASLHLTRNTDTPLAEFKRNVQELQRSAIHISIPRVSSNDTLSKQKERYEQLSIVMLELMNRIESGKLITPEEVQRLRLVHRTMKMEEPEDVLKRLVGDLAAADKTAARCRKMLDSLIGGQSLQGDFPINPSYQSIDRDWHAVREEIVNSTITENSSPLPLREVLGYFASAVDRFLEGRYPEESLVERISTTTCKPLENRCVLQTLLGALICRWVFAGSLSLFEGQHSGISMNIYSMIYMDGGIEAVRNTDLRATKMLLKDEVFQKETIPKEATFLSNRVAQLLKPFLHSKAELSNDENFYQVCESVIHLKLKLMISSVDYQIFYCQPGDQYDSTWMEAEDEGGRPLGADACKDKKIRLCLFPAIAQHQSTMSEFDPDDITTAFACNKQFSFQVKVGEVVDSKVIISKAVVLIEC